MGLLSFFHSVVCCVVMIYCIVIIYLPSMEEAETNFIVSIVFDIFYPEVFLSIHRKTIIQQASCRIPIIITTGAKAVYNNSDRAKHLKCVPGDDHFHFGSR